MFALYVDCRFYDLEELINKKRLMQVYSHYLCEKPLVDKVFVRAG